MGTTPNYALPYPESTEPADIPTDIHELATALEAKLRPAVVTTLPTTGLFDGLEVLYAADAANGIYWHLRYVAGATGSYKWMFVGGTPLAALDNTSVSTAGGWANLTPPVTITLPLAGDYRIGHGVGSMGNSGAGYGQARSAVAGVGNTDVLQVWGNNGLGVAPGWTEQRVNGLAAAAVVSQQYQATITGTMNASNRRLRATPIRVG